jgi:hypothetical protein
MAIQPVISLQEAMRSARLDEALITDAALAGREADYLRLAQLHEKLSPIFAEVPKYVDLFDLGMVGGDRPRIWIDMVSFIEMNAENRHFRFYKDTRDGRVLLAESNNQEAMAKVVTEYVARRLVSREKLLETESPNLQPSESLQPRNTLQKSETSAFSQAVAYEKGIVMPAKPKTNWFLSAILFIVFFTAVYLIMKAN